MRHHLLLSVAMGFCATLSAQFNYAPNAIAIPNLTHRFDGSVGVGFGRGEWLKSGEVQLAFSPANHVAMVANALSTGSKDILEGTFQGSRYQFWEAGMGVYQAYKHGSISLLAGMGQGELDNNYAVNRQSSFSIRRWFVQPGIAYQDNYFSGGVAFRFNRLEYLRGETDYAIEEYDLKAIRTIEENAPFFLPELGLRTGMHFSPVAINIHLTLVFPSLADLNYTMSNYTFALSLDIGELTKKKGKRRK